MPSANRRPWRMFLPLGLVLFLLLLWSAYWYVAIGQARGRLAAERATLAAQGITLQCSQEEWGGYPFHFEFTCGSPVVSYAGRFELRSAKLLLVALAYAPWQVAALIDGPTSLSAPGGVHTEITHQRALAAVTLDRQGKPSLSAEVPAVSVDGLGKADKLMLFTRPAATGGTEVALQGAQVTYQPPGRPAVTVDNGSLQGTLQPDQTFRIDKFELNQGAIRYWGSGKLALDPQHRLSGKIDTETNDSQALFAIVGPQLGLSDSKLANLRTVLGLLGSGAKAPVIAKDGALFFGPFQISELAPLY